MRSLRYAVVTIIPIGLVVAWLYGLMYLTGFALNYVTATIGAVSIGVGIDYSIHMTERFREEMRRASDKLAALRQAANGTGVALLASAASSIVGFTIMGFAPMPMFSSYGILTALMIFLALLASLVVLPSLLLLVTPEKAMENTSRFHRSKGS
jgi:predicted RND superfamily exporter protein